MFGCNYHAITPKKEGFGESTPKPSFSLTVAFSVVRRFWRVLIRSKSYKKQIKTPEISRFRCFLGGDYWTRTSDLLRVKQAL